MEEKINISEILKDKPQGTKLYSPICGECKLSYIESEKLEPQISTESDAFGVFYFWDDGKAYNEGECLLFPSDKMRDWAKFAWKKGDALSCGVDNLCIFEKWANEKYTEFYAKFVTPNYSGNTFKTEKWSKETNEAVIKQYISNIEEFKGGKLNLTTLEIENTQLEFKDGDIVVYGKSVAICRKFYKHTLCFYVSLNDMFGLLFNDEVESSEEYRFATEEEKQQLFSALEKEGKDWDSEHKMIVDLKPKYEFKPMDLCLMKYIGKYNNRGWELCQYAYTEHRVSSSGEQRDFYHSVGGEIYAECIPYNEDTKHLLGTKTEWKGCEV